MYLRDLPDPRPDPDGVIIKVGATGLCRSDWHGWRGHDPDITLPHVPGHEFAGTVIEVGEKIQNWKLLAAMECRPLDIPRFLK